MTDGERVVVTMLEVATDALKDGRWAMVHLATASDPITAMEIQILNGIAMLLQEDGSYRVVKLQDVTGLQLGPRS